MQEIFTVLFWALYAGLGFLVLGLLTTGIRETLQEVNEESSLLSWRTVGVLFLVSVTIIELWSIVSGFNFDLNKHTYIQLTVYLLLLGIIVLSERDSYSDGYTEDRSLELSSYIIFLALAISLFYVV